MYFRRPQSAPLKKPGPHRASIPACPALPDSTSKSTSHLLLHGSGGSSGGVLPSGESDDEGVDATCTAVEGFFNGVQAACEKTRQSLYDHASLHETVCRRRRAHSVHSPPLQASSCASAKCYPQAQILDGGTSASSAYEEDTQRMLEASRTSDVPSIPMLKFTPVRLPMMAQSREEIASPTSYSESAGFGRSADQIVSPRIANHSHSESRHVHFASTSSKRRSSAAAPNAERGEDEDAESSELRSRDGDGEESCADKKSTSSSAARPSSGALRRHLGLPRSIAGPLEEQICSDAENTFTEILNALRKLTDKDMNKAVSVLRMTNESIQSMTNMMRNEQRRSSSSADAAPVPADCHWFSAQNIVLERVAGSSNDSFGLAEAALANKTEAELLHLKAFAGQARRGFPTGGFVPGGKHPFSVICEPMIPFSAYEGVGQETATRIRSNVRVLLVGMAHRAANPDRRLLGHELGSGATKRLLSRQNECVYHARVEAERQHRKEARARRDAERGINPFYVRAKPSCAAPYSNSILQHSSDDLMVSTSYWLGDGGGGQPSDGELAPQTSPNMTADEATIARLKADISKTFGPSGMHGPGQPQSRMRSTRRVFPPSLTQLILEKEQAALRPLRQQKEVRGVRALPNFIPHEELLCTPHFMVVYEEPEASIELGQLLVEVDEILLQQCNATNGPCGSQRRKQLDPSRATVLVKDLRKAPPKAMSVIEFTTRWGGRIEDVEGRALRDVSARRWFRFPSLPAVPKGGDTTVWGIPLTELMEVCGHGSVSIDVKNTTEETQYRHSFTFGSSNGLRF